ncbi:MAG TPA: glycosyltransferase [Saprospiraceae bacterium]|nr:glycosyltransferase [Saprospiraceae bacterium]
MMYLLTIFLIGLYAFFALLITLYCLLQFNLWYLYKNKTYSIRLEEEDLPAFHPMVTIQLPVFNEKFVLRRLVDRIVEMDYPKDRFQIQILDDSTDETLQLSESLTDQYSKEGFDIELIHRKDRSGYKAGALDNGLKTAKGDFIAIFDADFLPEKNFLRRTLPRFKNKKVGVVQTRWTHLNQDYSLLTRLQALQLNVHFTVEQRGRYVGNLLLQFNGTAGVWRKDTIHKAGGWQTDTITEDLDLSYRAQLAGYKIDYLEMVGSPAELPVEISSLKSQQFRWMKGGAETARKLLPVIWKSKKLSLRQKLHATGHLLNSSIFLLILLTGLLSVPLMLLLRQLQIEIPWMGIGFIGLISIVVVYYEANVRFLNLEQKKGKTLIKFILIFPVFLALSMGLSLHNTVAVIQGYLGKKTEFVRTPKFNITQSKGHWRGNPYIRASIKPLVLAEGFLGLCFAWAFINGILNEDYGFAYMHLLFSVGFMSIFLYSFKHALAKYP